MIRYCLSGLVVIACLFAATGQAADRPPNVVLILADDLGYNDISLHGNTQVRTPNIDAIGSGGVWFTRGHTTAPVCAPSRAGLMTGRNQQLFGFEFVPGPAQLFINLSGGEDSLEQRGAIVVAPPGGQRTPVSDMGIPTSQVNLAEMLKAAHYTTAIFGKWHLGNGPRFSPPFRGFDESEWSGQALYGDPDDPEMIDAKLPWDPIDAFLWSRLPFSINRGGSPFTPDVDMTTYQGSQGVRFIEDNKDKPFFLYMPFFAPHTPLQAPKRYYDRLDHIADHKTRVYYAMIECMDDAIGRITAKLRELGLEENTLVIFTSDNGAAAYTRIPNTNQPFRGAKLNYYQGGVVVPYLMRWPAGLPQGTVVHDRVSLMDIYPTIAAAVGTVLPEGEAIVTGVNLLPYIRGERTGAPREALVWRSGRYKAVWHGDYRLQIDENQNKTVLYNVRLDIGERNNLVHDEPETVRLLEALLDRSESRFVEPLWTTPFYSPIPVDIWADGPPADAEQMYFGG